VKLVLRETKPRMIARVCEIAALVTDKEIGSDGLVELTDDWLAYRS